MASNFLWGDYASSATNWLSTELNSLANSSGNVLSTLGASFNNGFSNSAGYIYADVEFFAGANYTPTAGGFIELWLLRSIDGTNFDDGSATIAPGRLPDVVIPVRAGASIRPRAVVAGVILPPGLYKPIARNQTGATLPASGNTIRFRPYTQVF
jgi:hypothetical protein